MRDAIGGALSVLGWLVGGVNYLATAFAFFADDRIGLGLIQLAVPPAELILPWLAGVVYGVASIVSLGLLVLGAAVAE